jgi:glutamyl-tRNA reductase
VCEANRAARQKELPKAIRIVESETDRFMADLHFKSVQPIVSLLRQAYIRPKESELERLFKKLPHLDEGMQHEIRRSFDRLTNKLMHRPLASLRTESQAGIPYGLMEAVSQLFRFKS